MYKIRLTYRAFARQHRSVEDQFERVYRDVLELCHQQSIPAREVDPVHVSGPDTSYWPLHKSVVDESRQAGLTLAFDQQSEGSVALVRQWKITIMMRDEVVPVLGHIEIIRGRVGNVFTNIEIIEEIFTDVAPQ